ncbi:ABC transporter permease subunit [bacterium]|nr:ABC transporter permease subunit [bacterium]
MPIHDLGYRPWNGYRTAPLLRPIFVAKSGISLVWRRRWLRLMLMLSWIPIIFPAMGIFAFEYSSSDPEMKGFVTQLISGPMRRPDLAYVAMTDPDAARHEVWSTLILTFFRYPQLCAMVLLVGLIAPMLISYDLRSKAYLLYFSRPLRPMEYIAGKAAVLCFFLTATITFPALILYFLGILLSPSLSVVVDTWDIPLRIMAATLVLVIPTTSLALCYSSLTSESRYATISWFATWILGIVAYQILTFMRVLSGPGRGRRARALAETSIDFDRYRLLSPYHTLGKVESWCFGLDPTPGSVWPAFLVLLVITFGGIWIVRRRILARLSV